MAHTMHRRRTAPRTLPKQARSRQTVDAILEATARVLVREGYDRASTNRIAEVAGVSIGSLYQFFPSKQALFAALRQRHFDEITRVLSDMAALRSLPLRSAVRAAIDLLIRLHRVDPQLHKALEEEVPGDDIERNRELERQLHELTLDYLREHQAEVRSIDLEVAALIVVQTVEALTHAAVVHFPERLNDDRFAEEITEMIVRYLQADGAARAGLADQRRETVGGRNADLTSLGTADR